MNPSEHKVLLLEGVDPSAETHFREAGFTAVERLAHALAPEELVSRGKEITLLGIRSRTQLDRELLQTLPNLEAVGCFCIGTNQVAIEAAAERGIPVFNAPHSNTRSVAEMVIGLSIMLQRQIFAKSMAAHEGHWTKTAKGSREVRGKTIGIVGYGNIGSQVSVLAEALGMRVLSYDVQPRLPLGNAQAVDSLDELLKRSEIVTLHVPETAETCGLIAERELALMQPGSTLINASRGQVVDLEALATALKAERLAGAAVDVFPIEPQSNEEKFESPLCGIPSVILTPHVGGATLEAQANIGQDVAMKLIEFVRGGATAGAVNFPRLFCGPRKSACRLLHAHRNVPGMLSQISQLLESESINISGQHLDTLGEIGYAAFDLERIPSDNLINQINSISGTLRTRLL